ncbi:MAG: hypothetical protein GY754_24880 [bacterium]|nr:hypothetical protein [bacterium]
MKKSIQRISIFFFALVLSSLFSGVYSFANNHSKKVDSISQATPRAQDDLPPKSDTYQVLGKVKGLKKFVVKYNNRLFRGGDILSEAGIKALKKRGIKTIISITPTKLERKLAKKHGIELVEITFDKNGIPAAKMKKAIKIFKNGNAPFYVHCHGGTHRAGALCAGYRVYIDGWSFEKALVEYGMLGGNLMHDYNLYGSIKNLSKGV